MRLGHEAQLPETDAVVERRVKCVVAVGAVLGVLALERLAEEWLGLGGLAVCSHHFGQVAKGGQRALVVGAARLLEAVVCELEHGLSADHVTLWWTEKTG